MWERWLRVSLLLTSVVLAGFLGIILFTRGESGPSVRSQVPGEIEPAAARIQDFTFTQTKGDRVQWRVQADHARLFEKEQEALLETVRITLYGVQGRELVLSGEEGHLNTSTKDFTLANKAQPIDIMTESGYLIRTNHLRWADDRQEIHTDDPVTITGNGLQIHGRGLVGKLDVEEFRVVEDVHVVLTPAS